MVFLLLNGEGGERGAGEAPKFVGGAEWSGRAEVEV
jgi:hypothetical protein